MPTTPNLGLPYPVDPDSADVPRDMQLLAEAVDGQPGLVPIGCLMLWAAAAAPTGWLLCQGQLVSAASYPKLAAVLGSSGGNVTIPDLRTRVPVGAGTGFPLNAKGGEATHALTVAELPAHSHIGGAHQHGPGAMAASASGGLFGGRTALVATNWQGPFALAGTTPPANVYTATSALTDDGNHTHALNGLSASAGAVATSSVGGSSTPLNNNMPPYLALNYIIRAG